MAETPVDLDTIRNIANAATPGPWVTDVEIDGMYAECKTVVRAVNADPWRSRIVTVGQTRMHISADGAGEANVAFIAAARELVPAMADEIERLRAQVAQLRTELDEYPDRIGEAWRYGDELERQRDRVLAALDVAEERGVPVECWIMAAGIRNIYAGATGATEPTREGVSAPRSRDSGAETGNAKPETAQAISGPATDTAEEYARILVGHTPVDNAAGDQR